MPSRPKTSRLQALPWYHQGLRFECTQCGRCCGGEPGVVWVSPAEARAIAKRLDIPVEEFYEVYTHTEGRRVSLTEKPNGDCVMLEAGGCTIYEERPLQCRTYPWWPWNLKTQEDWEAVARECAGCNRGKRHSFQEIEEQRGKRL